MAAFKRAIPGSSNMNPLALTPAAFTSRDLQIVEAMLADIAPQWSVELHGISAEDTSLIILPEDGEDALGPSLMISREDYGLRLDQIHWDELTEIGTFSVLAEVVGAIARILQNYSDFKLPASVTIH
ncbi:MAG TPA: hypothetical protein VFG62_05150 [Rhodopila sp.]|jgi:hypothetical protein|nr:hypothetical protein [Rhodopila sp.]